MNAIAAISEALLRGEILTIKTAFKDFGVTNLPRELSRGIEKKFGVVVSRVKRTGKTRYKVPCWWTEYRINPTIEGNREGMTKMIEYVKKEGGIDFNSSPMFSRAINQVGQSPKSVERLF